MHHVKIILIGFGIFLSTSGQSAPTAQYLLGQIQVRLSSGPEESAGVSLWKRTLDIDQSAIVEEVLFVPAQGQIEEHISILKVKGSDFVIADGSKRFEGAGKLTGKPWKWTSWETWARLEDGSGSFHAKHHTTKDGILSKREFFDRQGKLRMTYTEEMRAISQAAYETLHSRLRAPGMGRKPLG